MREEKELRSAIVDKVFQDGGIVAVDHNLVVIENASRSRFTQNRVLSVGRLREMRGILRELLCITNNQLRDENGLSDSVAVIIGLGGGRSKVDTVSKARKRDLGLGFVDLQSTRLEDETNTTVWHRTDVHC